MSEKKISNIFFRALGGYKGLFNGLRNIILFLLISAACGIIIVFPFWWLAVNHPQAYTAAAALPILAAIVYYAAVRIKKSGPKRFSFARLRKIGKPFLKIISSVCLLYFSAFLFYWKLWYFAAPLLAATLFFIGYLLSVKKSPNNT